MSDVDTLFTPTGFAVYLNRGGEVTVETGPTVTSAVRLSLDDLSCVRCGRPIDTPERKPARFLALNKSLNDGLCRRCDPVVGPSPPI